jgi:hypothetical protein
MSKSFAKLADFLLDSYVEAAFMTASELAHTLDLDAATVVRFSQSLNYSGYPDLQREIRARVKAELLIRPQEASDPKSVTGIAFDAMNEVSLALERTRNSLDIDALVGLVEQIGAARRIVVLAEGPTQPTAYSFVLYLEQGGFPVYIARSGIADLARTVNISLASARFADITLSAQAHPGIGIGIVSLEAVVYALSQVLRWRFADRYTGSEQAVTKFVKQIQSPLK